MEICKPDACTGCLVCKDICARKAITISPNEQGFLYPKINDELCIQCSLCVSVCPINSQNKNQVAEKVYASWNRDNRERLSATSGGVFTSLARAFIKSGGIVYGAAFDDKLEVHHIRIDSLNELPRIRGSKYVQSNTEGIYCKVKADLNANRKVLFSGTPCQISALKNFLHKNYELLFCVDIVCHGVPSPLVLKDYVHSMEVEQNSCITNINFRYKKPGWSVFSMKVDFQNGKSYRASKYKDPYLGFFLVGGGDLTLRKSCFECRFTSPERTGDLTLADFWCYRPKNRKSKGVEKGINLVLVNTEKGKKLYNLTDELVIESHTWEEAHKTNKQLSEPNKEPIKYKDFWTDYINGGYSIVVKKYYNYDKKTEKRACIGAWKRAHVYIIPEKLLKIIKKILR